MKNRRGILLVDMMVYVVLVSIVAGSACTAFFYFTRSCRLQGDYLHDIERTFRCGEFLKRSVRAADAAPDRWDPFTAGTDCLILVNAAGEPVIYRLEEGTLVRYSGPLRLARAAALEGVRGFTVSRRTYPGGTVVEVTIELQPRSVNMRVVPRFRFTALVGEKGAYGRPE